MCGYPDAQSVQYSLVLPDVTSDAYIFIKVHLFGCLIRLEPSFD